MESGVVKSHELEKLMCKLHRERARVIKKFVERALSLEVGGEFFQCHLAALPEVEELRKLLNETGTDRRFHVWPTINGTWVKREA